MLILRLKTWCVLWLLFWLVPWRWRYCYWLVRSFGGWRWDRFIYAVEFSHWSRVGTPGQNAKQAALTDWECFKGLAAWKPNFNPPSEC